MNVQQIYTPFDPCPSGTTAAPSGALVVEGTAAPKSRPGWQWRGFQLSGTPQPSAAQNDYGGIVGPLACVGTLAGSYEIGSEEQGNLQTVSVYDRIVWQQPQSPRAIDVYQAGQFLQRFHY
jgi:hypothetical protein